MLSGNTATAIRLPAQHCRSPRTSSATLVFAKGSCGELRTQPHIGIEAGLLERGRDFLGEAVEISRMLQGLIRRIGDRLASQAE